VPTEYATIQIPKATKDKIEDFRRRYGYPSCSQAVTALAERHSIAEDIKKTLVEDVGKEVTKEAINVITTQFFELLVDVSGKFNKPISNLTVDELIHGLREVKAERKSTVSSSSQRTP
jgi:hypothetical protein